MRRSPTPGAGPHPLQPVLERACHEGAQAAARRAGAGPDSSHQPDGQFDGEHHGPLRDRHPVWMALRHLDISSSLPQGHLVAPDKGPEGGRDGDTAQQRQRPIDALGVLTGLSPPARAHVP
jgi:hypothetical protein